MTNPTNTGNATRETAAPRTKLRITARALLEGKRLSDPCIHPDGRRVAFVVEEADFDESRWVSHIWLTEWIPAEEEKREDGPSDQEPPVPEEDPPEEPADPTRQLTFSHDGETDPRWSPDGRYLAFLSSREDPADNAADEDDDPKAQLWILPIDGGEARKVATAKEGILAFDWMPESDTLIYLAIEPRPSPVESVRKEQHHRYRIDPIVEQEDRLRRQFWRVGVEDRKPKLLFTGDYGIQEFALSPSGQRICYATNYSGEWNDYHRVDLWLLETATGETQKLVDRPGGKTHPRWSADGSRIAFLSWLDPQLSYSRQTLFIQEIPPPESVSDNLTQETPMPGSPAPPTALDPNFDYDLHQIEWSRHHDGLYALAAVRTGTELVRCQPDDTTPLASGESAFRQDIDLDPGGGAIVYVQESAQALPEIFLRDEQGETHCLTKLNAAFGENYHLPRQEVVEWTSQDGLQIQGVLTYPVETRIQPPYPLIVQIHGGPKGCAMNTLQSYSMPPVWSAEGYAVLRPNFRGSEGYGNAFAIANRRDLGGGDYADILAGVDWCIAQGIADPNQLGVMGGSYGGYMTNWIIGQTTRFQAAISMFGIFHLQTDYSNSDLSRWDNEYLGAYYWEDPEIYRRLSPGSYVDQIRTPTLILHGDEDNNTFISNSKELYQALRHRGVTTQFVHYPREGHGLGEPNHKLDEMRRCLAWMDRYVLRGGQEPTIYRLGDRVPDEEKKLELCVARAGSATYLGQPTEEKTGPVAAILLEVAFIISNPDTRHKPAPLTLALNDLRLEIDKYAPDFSENGNGLIPIGVPFEVAGGKVLLEGDRLRINQRPDAESGQFAFGCAIVFRVPIGSGGGRFRCPGFPPVSLTWNDEENETEEESEKKGETAS